MNLWLIPIAIIILIAVVGVAGLIKSIIDKKGGM